MKTTPRLKTGASKPKWGHKKLKMLQHSARISAKPIAHAAPISIVEVRFNWARLFSQQYTFTHFRAASDGSP